MTNVVLDARIHPVEGGSANDYDYANGDPINNFDLTGLYCLTGENPNGTCRSIARGLQRNWKEITLGVIVVGAIACTVSVACGVAVAGALGSVGLWGGSAALTVSPHAAERMIQRGISQAAIEKTIASGQGFTYWHEGAWKVGFYDAASRVFVGISNNTVRTVINTGPQYIQNLMSKRP